MIYCEFFKLKRSKIAIITFLGTVLPPILSIIFQIKNYLSIPDYTITVGGTMDQVFMLLMLIFGPLVYTIMGAYLFSREYAEKTLKTLFVIPISKNKFIISKFLTLFICILMLMTLTVIEVSVVCALCNMVIGTYHFSILKVLASVIYFSFKIIYGSVLLYAVITPFVYLALRTNGFIFPTIAVAVTVLINVVLSGAPIAGFIPWTAVYPLLTGQMHNDVSMPVVSILLIVVLCIASMWASISHFEKEDIK